MKKLFTNPVHIIPSIVFIVGALFLGLVTYSNLNKGFIFNDEAYYLSYFKNKGESLSFDRTNFFRIFKFLYTPNIYHFRIISITALVASNFLFIFSVLKYLKFDNKLFIYSLLGVFIGFETWSINNLIIQQYIGNTILVNVGLSLMMIALMVKKPFIIIGSGFVLSFVLFNGNSHTIVLIPILVFMIVSNIEQWKISLLYFIIGNVLGFAVYFIFLDSLEHFFSQLVFLKEYLSFHKKQHSKTFMVLWCVYLFLNAVLPSMITYFLLWKSKFSLNSIKIFDQLLAFLGLITIVLFIFFENYFSFSFIVFTHLMAIRFMVTASESKHNKYLILLLLIIPYCLAFGSQTWFHLRLNAYKFYYFLLIFICIIKIYKRSLWMIGYCLILSIMVIKFPSILYTKGWKDFVFIEQTEKVKINGYDLLLDKGRKKDIEDLRPYLQNQKKVIYSSNHLIGYLYILDASPPIYYYFTLKDYIQFIIKKTGNTPDDYIYIESNDYPFYHKEIVPMKFVSHPEKYKVIKTGRFTLYLPSNFQKK